MDKCPRVSVLMTVHNAAPYLREAIDSILCQTFADWELIVFENGSTDASPAIVASYADPRVRVTRSPRNIGRTPALRQAFDLARGEYFAVLDADDRSAPERLAKQVAYLDGHSDVVLVGSWALHINEGGATIDRWTPSPGPLNGSIGWGNVIVHSSVMYRAGVASEVGGYPANLPFAQDFGLWLRLAQRGTLAMMGEYLCEQRVISNRMSRQKQYRVDLAQDSLTLLAYARDHLNLGPDGLRRNREEVTIMKVKYGVALIGNGRIVRGCQAIGGALWAAPSAFFHNRVFLKRWYR